MQKTADAVPQFYGGVAACQATRPPTARSSSTAATPRSTGSISGNTITIDAGLSTGFGVPIDGSTLLQRHRVHVRTEQQRRRPVRGRRRDAAVRLRRGLHQGLTPNRSVGRALRASGLRFPRGLMWNRRARREGVCQAAWGRLARRQGWIALVLSEGGRRRCAVRTPPLGVRLFHIGPLGGFGDIRAGQPLGTGKPRPRFPVGNSPCSERHFVPNTISTGDAPYQTAICGFFRRDVNATQRTRVLSPCKPRFSTSRHKKRGRKRQGLSACAGRLSWQRHSDRRCET